MKNGLRITGNRSPVTQKKSKTGYGLRVKAKFSINVILFSIPIKNIIETYSSSLLLSLSASAVEGITKAGVSA